MKKYSLNNFYAEAEKILQDAKIEITLESKLEVSAVKTKNHITEIIEVVYIIRFLKKERDDDYLFIHGETPKLAIIKFRAKLIPDLDNDIQL